MFKKSLQWVPVPVLVQCLMKEILSKEYKYGIVSKEIRREV